MYTSQYGFREAHSTGLALMELIEDITSNLDNNLVTTGVFIDLKKAFDTIDHSILFNKLCHYGVRGIVSSWIKYYLTNKKQFVCYGGICSDYRTMLCGVPQGSIFGPILFLLYINELANISNKLKFILFADDTNVFCAGKSITEVNNILNNELK
jgi:hypothetical protein